MSEEYYHQWYPLAEVHFASEDCEEDYIYCLCSRAFVRDGVKLYYVEKEEATESDNEAQTKSSDHDEHSHVHFSAETPHKEKCEKDEVASCYCSASHTDNYYSTDEHDTAHNYQVGAILPSDSGADLTFQESNIESNKPYKATTNIVEEDEDYLAFDSFEKFWAAHGERLIWASWINKYSDYINPDYINESNSYADNEDYFYEKNESLNKNVEEDCMRERKFSYDSKLNPCKKTRNNLVPDEKLLYKDDKFLPIARRRSCSEHERIVSPRTIGGTDSMTNVTKMTFSSYDVTSSRVSSQSSASPCNFSLSSSSDDQFNDQTTILNDEHLIEDTDNDQYWQLLWKKHFGENYANHYANYVECLSSAAEKDALPFDLDPNSKKRRKKTKEKRNAKSASNAMPTESNVGIPASKEVQREVVEVKKNVTDLPKNITDLPKSVIDVQRDVQNEVKKDFIEVKENAKDLPKDVIKVKKNVIDLPKDVIALKKNVTELATDVTEVQKEIDKLELKEKPKPVVTKKRASSKFIGSVGVLLQNLLKEGNIAADNEVVDCVEGSTNSGGDTKPKSDDSKADNHQKDSSSKESANKLSPSREGGNGNGGDPPDDKVVTLKRSHEIDSTDTDDSENPEIKSVFDIIGLAFDSAASPKGTLMYKNRYAKLKLPFSRKPLNKKTYFDDDGDPLAESQEEKEIQTDNENQQSQPCNEGSSTDNLTDSKTDAESLNTVNLEINEDGGQSNECLAPKVDEIGELGSVDNSKKKRRRKRREIEDDTSQMPEEIINEPKLKKYWKKRHSLFNRFDEGIRLDMESWFSVSPEKVARHIAERCRCDLVVDAFCGAAGNAIQLALVCQRVIAIDIDPVKIELARHNATVYGVADRIEFVLGDFFDLAPTLKADVVFLSPPWGGPQYIENESYDLETMLEPKPASVLMAAALAITNNVALYVPRNSRSEQLVELSKQSGAVEIEQNFLGHRYVAITAYYGELVNYGNTS